MDSARRHADSRVPWVTGVRLASPLPLAEPRSS